MQPYFERKNHWLVKKAALATMRPHLYKQTLLRGVPWLPRVMSEVPFWASSLGGCDVRQRQHVTSEGQHLPVTSNKKPLKTPSFDCVGLKTSATATKRIGSRAKVTPNLGSRWSYSKGLGLGLYWFMCVPCPPVLFGSCGNYFRSLVQHPSISLISSVIHRKALKVREFSSNLNAFKMDGQLVGSWCRTTAVFPPYTTLLCSYTYM